MWQWFLFGPAGPTLDAGDAVAHAAFLAAEERVSLCLYLCKDRQQ